MQTDFLISYDVYQTKLTKSFSMYNKVKFRLIFNARSRPFVHIGSRYRHYHPSDLSINILLQILHSVKVTVVMTLLTVSE